MKLAATGPAGVRAWPSPSLYELEVTPPRFVVRATLLLLLALVAGLCGWSLVAQLDIVATAPGKLIPLSQVKLVQAPESGIVKEILVVEGDRVSVDQVLMRRDSTLAVAEAEQVANELQLKRLVIRAIDAELSDRSYVAAKFDSPLLFEQVRALFTAR